MKHIYIAYSPKDVKHVVTMRENLMRIGYRPWLDPNPRPGQDWRFAHDDAIRAADAVIVIVTPAAADSVYVTYEWSLALGAGVPVIPVIFRGARMHPRLQTLEHFDYVGFREPHQFWDYFTREIQRVLNLQPHPQAIQDSDVPPVAAPPALPPQPHPSQPPAYTRSVMPAEPGFYLVVRRGPELNTMHKLAQDTITLGRDASNDIAINDPEISRNHLKLHWQGDGFAVEDLNSTNGTRINGGARITRLTRLYPGQTLMLGDAIILSYEAVS